MLLKVNTVEVGVYPKEFSVTPLDLDNSVSSVRTANGILHRDRIAVKRQIDMSWGQLTWAQISALLQSMSAIFFDFYYPDPMTGVYETKTFYVGNRPSPVAVETGGVMMWAGLKIIITEK